MSSTQPILPLQADVDLRIIKTRQKNSSQPLGSCMSLQNLKKTRVRHLRSTSWKMSYTWFWCKTWRDPRKASTSHQRNRCSNCIDQWWSKKPRIWELGPTRSDKSKGSVDSCLAKPYIGYVSDEDKDNGISIIAKNNDEAEHLYLSICWQHG